MTHELDKKALKAAFIAAERFSIREQNKRIPAAIKTYLAARPAPVVDEAMVERACAKWAEWSHHGADINRKVAMRAAIQAALASEAPKPMNIDKEWCAEAGEREGGLDISAGSLADPLFKPNPAYKAANAEMHGGVENYGREWSAWKPWDGSDEYGPDLPDVEWFVNVKRRGPNAEYFLVDESHHINWKHNGGREDILEYRMEINPKGFGASASKPTVETVKYHEYQPDKSQFMGDCAVCGNVRQAEVHNITHAQAQVEALEAECLDACLQRDHELFEKEDYQKAFDRETERKRKAEAQLSTLREKVEAEARQLEFDAKHFIPEDSVEDIEAMMDACKRSMNSSAGKLRAALKGAE